MAGGTLHARRHRPTAPVGLGEVLAEQLLGRVGVVVAVQKTLGIDAQSADAKGVLDSVAAHNQVAGQGANAAVGLGRRRVERGVSEAKILPKQGGPAAAVHVLRAEAPFGAGIGAEPVLGVQAPAGFADLVLVALVAKGLAVDHPAVAAGGIASAGGEAQSSAAARTVVPAQAQAGRLAVGFRQGAHHDAGLGRRFPGAQVNDAVERRRSVEGRGRAFDHFDLVEGLHGHGGPLHATRVGAKCR